MNDLIKLVDEFLVHKRTIQNCSLKSCEAYQHDLLRKFIPYLISRQITKAEDITQPEIETFLATVKNNSKTNSVANINRKLASIKSFFEYLRKRHIVTINPANEIKSLKQHTRTIAYLKEEEKAKFLETVEKTSTRFYRARDVAIINLFLGSGIRVSELTNIRIKHLDFSERGNNYIHITRKGGNEVRLPINAKVTSLIKNNLQKRDKINEEDYVFESKTGKPLDPKNVYHLVKSYLQKAGINKPKRGPHLLRHSVGVSLRRSGIDLATIQHLLGHQKLETTSIYLNIEMDDLKKAVSIL